MWFRLPPGYHTLDAIALDELENVTSALLTPILQSEQGVDHSLRDARAFLSLLDAMHQGGSIHTSIGVHPDGEDGACVSLFSLSVTDIAARTAGLAVAQSALALANSPLWSGNTRRILELPIGVSAALVAGTLSAPPRSLLEDAGISATPSEVFQARLTVSYPSGAHIAVADLTSAATRHAGAYIDILEGIAQTITFAAPVPSAACAPRPSRILEVLS
ncbi:hypothetical protein OG735_35505 [Streptomyces sp. NBC_01210]|uniref:hypothetical protein n=1 Tax=Streptomyces sp. NBC_01210 TaxID=2903774 RepID=UPI002E11C50E|nr:hypothetical protein OG735_35505 [Streptomyces sp. NBC_01210]